MSKHTVPYELGHAHGKRGQPLYKFFTPEGCFEDLQYRQGYLDGRVKLQKDIENDQRNRLARLRAIAAA